VFFIYHRAIYRAVWAEAQNLGDDTLLRKVLEKAGVPATELMAETERQDVKDRLRQNTEPGRGTRRVRSADVVRR
jgi:2-hydroxychromene-2-carboxylate isomerase